MFMMQGKLRSTSRLELFCCEMAQNLGTDSFSIEKTSDSTMESLTSLGAGGADTPRAPPFHFSLRPASPDARVRTALFIRGRRRLAPDPRVGAKKVNESVLRTDGFYEVYNNEHCVLYHNL